MTAWRYGKALLILLAGISIALKLIGTFRAPTENTASISDVVTVFLGKQGFTTSGATSDVDLFSVSASSGDCRILVAILSPQGWHRDVIRSLTPPGDQLVFYYDGQTYSDQPVLRTRFNNYLDIMFRTIGLTPRPRPVIGVVATSACNLNDLQWSELAASFPS